MRAPSGCRWWVLLVAAVGVSALLPFVSSSDYVIRVAVNTVLFALLALGLNVVVGWAGLLDLGYVAFYGFGAYVYALLSSPQFGLHFPALLSVSIVIVSSALLGLLLGLPSRRLVGDYLAIVTLFFAQIYVVLATNADRITFPWNDGPTDISGGPNGITDIDPLSILGYEFDSTRQLLSGSRSASSPSSSWRCSSSTTRAPGGRGARSARTRSRPR